MTEFEQQVKDLFKTYPTREETVLHATTGMMGESGELLDSFKKVWIYVREPDRVNIREELGDLRFYMTAYVQSLSIEESWAKLTDAVTVSNVSTYINMPSPHRPIMTKLGKMIMHEAVFLDNLADSTGLEPNSIYMDASIESLVKMYTLVRAIEVGMNISVEEIEDANLQKLSKGKKARYKDGYSDKAAQVRADKQ